MYPLFILAIPLLIVIIGLLMNSMGVPYDHPTPEPQADPIKRISAERDCYLDFINLQRTRAINRRRIVTYYGSLLVIVIAGSFLWMYEDTVSKTTLSTRIASIETLKMEDGTGTVLSLTLKNGGNSKYLIRPAETYQITRYGPGELASNKVSSWELSKTATAVNTSGSSVPAGLVLEISYQKRS